MTLAQAIVAQHAAKGAVAPGELVTVYVDRIYLQDGNTPTIAKLFRKYGFTQVFDPQRIGVFFDHAVLVSDLNMSDRLQEAEAFARSMGLLLFPPGTGISHLVALEEGWFKPGSIVIGADSHTCTGGVMQSLAIGMGASDVVAAMVSGRTWLRVPETVCIKLIGMPSPRARAKDVMLYVLAKLGMMPFLYKSVEWTGNWLETLSFDAAVTIANLGVEMGAKCVFLPPGPGRWEGLGKIDPPDSAESSQQLLLDIEGLPPFVAKPHIPTSGVPLDQCAGQQIDYVFIGSCANGRLEDLQEIARVMAQGHVHSNVHCVVTPGSRTVYLEALRLGLVETIVRAGGLVTPPGCGACVGTQGSIPASGQRVLSTMSRNFRGRMGNPNAEIWLASPLVAAYTALLGRIPRLADML